MRCGTLETVVRIAPRKNTKLMGLYASKDGFCTQCEAHGFRRITYFLDRPDVMATYTTHIEADRARYPVLLSNGNREESVELPGGRQRVRWRDPFKKPCYLFALVAGDLRCHEGKFTTAGECARLEICVEPQNEADGAFALRSLERAMRWDEERFGREYDLDVYMIVAVHDFNMGAMENKGLNIFNAKYVLARPDTATDDEYEAIDGDRPRVLPQLDRQPGHLPRLVPADPEGGPDGLPRPELQRRHDVAPGEAHPGRAPAARAPVSRGRGPDGAPDPARVVRLDGQLLYRDRVREGRRGGAPLPDAPRRRRLPRGMDLYFERHDGQAVTCDDFRAAMADANGVDLTQFERWYAQAGTPQLREGPLRRRGASYELTLTQSLPGRGAGRPAPAGADPRAHQPARPRRRRCRSRSPASLRPAPRSASACSCSRTAGALRLRGRSAPAGAVRCCAASPRP